MHAAIDVVYRRNHIHHCTRGLWLDWQAQGTRVTQNLFHDNTPPAGTDITPLLGLGEDIFIEVSHGPTLIDNNLLLSPCSCRISTQGMAFVHNLIAGSFTWVDYGVENGAAHMPSPRYTPYHMPHRTEVAGFMTILHGDMRFYSNIFVQQPVREEYVKHAQKTDEAGQYNFDCGLGVYEDYPTFREYFDRFGPWKASDEGAKDKYYEHLPVDAAGNVYFNGAKPVSKEAGAVVDNDNEITWEIKDDGSGVRLETNLWGHIAASSLGIISSNTLGQAFESEQRFENPDGTQIVFDEDYFGDHRGINPMPGPFENADKAKGALFDIR